MIEQLDPAEHPAQTETFEPFMTREILAATAIRVRSDVVAQAGEGELPACLQVDRATRRAVVRIRLLLTVLALATLVQGLALLWLSHRPPVRIYEESVSEYLVKP